MGGRGYKTHGKNVGPGFSDADPPRHLVKVGRNDRCPCGSGKKYKECHEKQGTAYLEKLAREEAKQRLRERREALKLKGMPWYRRWLIR